MVGRTRFQFSVGNLMLAVVPLAVVFELASLAREAGWAVWLVAIGVGIGPAIGALIGGWNGMARGFGWFLIIGLYVYGTIFMFDIWSYLLAVIFTGNAELQTGSACGAVLLLGIGPVIGGLRGGQKGAMRGFAAGLGVMMALFFIVVVGFIAVVLVREHLAP